VKIATWNVNSLKARLPHVLAWLRAANPDVVLLQETKCLDEAIPALELGDLGYNIASVGQKAYNGVAVLSKSPIDVLLRGLPNHADDTQARYLEAFTGGVRVASIYAPNGNPVGSEKFGYKLSWLARLYEHARALLDSEDIVVLGGDYNVTPADLDVYDPHGWRNDALCQPASRAGLRRVMHIGFADAIRLIHPDEHCFTWWDYRAGAWAADQGLRIDHLLLSPQAIDRLQTARVDRTPRGWDKASDHAPVWCELS
jgi:exodeoxyribonuclease-3